MLTFVYPWLLALLPAPVLAYWLLPRAEGQQAAVRVPFFSALTAPRGGLRRRPRWSRCLLLSLIWLLLVGAAANPQWLGEPVALPTSGRDLMLAVDISDSMQIEDMQVGDRRVARLTAVKAVLSEFIGQRKGDRLGLILFGTNAYLQAPLTFDLATVERFLHEAQLRFAGPKTAIGDAIGLAVKRLRQRPGQRHVLVLLSDGSNTAGAVQPLAAAWLAREENIVIYTIGVGAEELTTSGPFGGIFGNRTVNPARDLDEETLQSIAQITGGRYFRARDPVELAQIYELLDELEPVAVEPETVRPRSALFHWPLSAALLLSFALALRLALPVLRREATA